LFQFALEALRQCREQQLITLSPEIAGKLGLPYLHCTEEQGIALGLALGDAVDATEVQLQVKGDHVLAGFTIPTGKPNQRRKRPTRK
jgi:hypothetical protein